MYIYNVTTNIEESVHDQWLQWMGEIHIPEMLATGKFLSAKMCRVLVEEDMGGLTYSVQYTAPDKETLQCYYAEDAPRLRKEAMARFQGKFVSFRTELEVVGDHHAELGQSATHLLFAYGTLQDKTVQRTHLLRALDGVPDRLARFRISNQKVANAYPTIVRTGNPKDSIEGTAYVVTHGELLVADRYEGTAYVRIQVELSSGKKAWVYLSPYINS